MTVSLLEILAAARSHAAPLASESAGYLLLAIADHVVSAPRVVDAEDVELLADGSVRLRSSAARDPALAEQVVRGLLARTLEVSSSVGPGLRRAAERREDTGLAEMVRELEIALIPVNRGAAKRALSRLHRETERARDAGKLAPLLAAASIVPPPAVPARVEAAAPALPPPSQSSEPLPVVTLPAVEALPPAAHPPARLQSPPVVELTLTPLPSGELTPALTKPEPVVLRAKERGASTPQLGTVVTAQTLPEEEIERTERAPTVIASDDEPQRSVDVAVDVDVDVDIDVDVELPVPADLSDDELTPVRTIHSAVMEPQPLIDPEPSQMPDVLTAMLELHTGLDADDAPTRLREVVTELLAVVQPVPLFTPEPQQVEDTWLTQSSLDDVVTSQAELVDPALYEAATWNPAPVAPIAPAASTVVETPVVVPVAVAEPELLLYRFESEQADPAEHEALTWYPAAVTSEGSPLPPALLVGAPAAEPSPYAPAVLPTRRHDVAELVDSFYVSGGSEETELRSALKEMAGIELTPMSHPFVDEG